MERERARTYFKELGELLCLEPDSNVRKAELRKFKYDAEYKKAKRCLVDSSIEKRRDRRVQNVSWAHKVSHGYWNARNAGDKNEANVQAADAVKAMQNDAGKRVDAFTVWNMFRDNPQMPAFISMMQRKVKR